MPSSWGGEVGFLVMWRDLTSGASDLCQDTTVATAAPRCGTFGTCTRTFRLSTRSSRLRQESDDIGASATRFGGNNDRSLVLKF